MSSWFSNYIGGPAVLIFIGVLISAVGALWATIDQAKIERKLTEKSEEIAVLNQKIANSITGGDSYPFLSFSYFDSENPNLLSYAIAQYGDYPLYDIDVRIVNLDKKVGLGTIHKVGNLAPGSAKFISVLDLGPPDTARINIFFSCRNGFFVQLARFRKVQDNWTWAWQIREDGKGKSKILTEHISNDFLKEGESVEWE